MDWVLLAIKFRVKYACLARDIMTCLSSKEKSKP